jgi:tripartite-type tricarboxylate transporter receptor subunit TctC
MKASLRAAASLLLSSIAVLGAANAVGATPGPADSYPSKQITIVVPFPPGGTTDVLARAVGQKLSDALHQPVNVENRPGAGATTGALYVAKAEPDGYTILMGAVHHTIASTVYSSLSYDFQKDLTPITVVALVPNVLAVNSAMPVQNVKELIAYGKTHPMSFGSNGPGTAQHLIGEEFSLMTGVKMTHVPYKGSSPLVTDLMAGQIQLSFDTITPDLPHIKSGKIRPLAVTTAKRSPLLPDVPTLAESGLAGFDMGSWFGLLAPAKTPPEIVKKLNVEIVKVLNRPDVQKTFADIGAQKVGDTPAQMAALIKSDTDKYGMLAKKIGVKVE